jgi:predicted ATP-grasp superfamily ATP-dependent carboligase
MNIIFNKQAILNSLSNREFEECKYAIYDDMDELTEGDQIDALNEAKHLVEHLSDQDILRLSENLGKKQNGKFRKGAVLTIHNVDIASYVTDFTSCWYHERISLRALDEDTIVVSLEGTQTTH